MVGSNVWNSLWKACNIVRVSTLAMKVQACNGRKFDEIGFPFIVIRASFTNERLKITTNFALLLTNVR